MTSVKTCANPTQRMEKFEIITDDDDKQESLVQYNRKTRKLIVLGSDLRDPQGNLVEDVRTANFIMAGSSSKSDRKKSKGKELKLPKTCSSTFGNEGIPKISRHLNPLRNYLYNQFANAQAINNTTVGAINNWFFTLGLLSGVSSYTSLYDEYCVRRIEMWFYPKVTENVSSSGVMPLLATAYDIDGATIAALTDVEQYDTAVITNATVGHYMSFTPSVAIATYGGAFTKYSYEMNQWLDVANTDINLYGACSFLTGGASNGDYSYNVETRFWVEFRGVR